ncbi:predicted protein, partial [Micromonas commoda]
YALLRMTLEAGGAAFIKWGQWASTRYDVFPAQLCKELELLQCGAPEHSWRRTKEILERAYGETQLDEIFAWMDKTPIASGSIAQIHRAKLRNGPLGERPDDVNDEGRYVAVKVRHPGVVEALRRDFAILAWIARATRNVEVLKPFQLEHTVQQFGVHMLQQVDLTTEASNLQKFEKAFSLWGDVSFPVPVGGLATEEVLVETFEDGAANAAAEAAAEMVPVENRALAAIGVKTLLKMLIDDNFLHADLHPGNILVRLPEKNDGRGKTKIPSKPEIVILDTGLATELTPAHQASLAEFFQAIINWDGAGVARNIIAFSSNLQPSFDPESFTSDVTTAVRHFQDSTPRAGDCMAAIFETVQRHHVTLDPNVMVAVVTVMVLEGWQFRLDPSINIL